MNDQDPPSPLSLLKASEPFALCPSEEAQRRQRIVGRIDSLRRELQKTPDNPPRPVFVMARVFESRFKWAFAALVPLAVAAGILWGTGNAQEPLVRVESGVVTLETSNGKQRLSDEGAWNAADGVGVSTEVAEATLTLPNRVHATVSPHTRLYIQRRTNTPSPTSPSDGSSGARHNLALDQGKVTLSGQMVTRDAPFELTTTHALVQVRATTFALTLEKLPSEGGRTRLVVREGEVSIFDAGQEHRLTAGQEWSSPSARSPATPATSSAPAASAEANDINVDPTPTPELKAKSALAQQNQMFESAQAARHAGNPNLALQRFAALIRKYPGSEQAHNARVEEFRLLRSLGRQQEAQRSARAYLRAHPRGFAAREATRIVNGEQ